MDQPLIRWNDPLHPQPSARPGLCAGVTVVIPHYRQLEQLRLTLTALDYQDHPAQRLQVVVADDGSHDDVRFGELGPHEFDLQVVRQERDGFGLARARNLGAAAAEGERLVFLDADMLPDRNFVSAHARALAGADYLVSIGDRKHVRPGLSMSELAQHLAAGRTVASIYKGQRTQEPAWRRDHLRRWDDLKADGAEAYRIASGGNLALHKAFYDDVGGTDGSFRRWGGEDLEFAFRATQWGALFRFNRAAMAWHQGEEAATSHEERRSQEEQLPLLTNKIASRYLRHGLGPRVYDVPHAIVGIRWQDGLERPIQNLVDGLLRHPMGVAVHVFGVHESRVRQILDRAYLSDPRVSVQSRTEVPAEISDTSAIPVRALIVEAGTTTAARLLQAVDLLESAQPRPAVVEIHSRNAGSECAVVWSAPAVARARRCASGDPSLRYLLAQASRVMGLTRIQADEVLYADSRRQEPSLELDVMEQRLRQLYWSLSPRTKRVLLRVVATVFRRTR